MVSIPDAAIGATIAALIAGTVSLLGLIISKEQKTSEFRQAWIDALRSDLAAFLTQINAILDATTVNYSSHAEKVETLRPMYITLNTSTFNILLRVNPAEKQCKKLLDAMEAFNAITADEAKFFAENVRLVEKEFLASSQALLKSEWRRVKSGERTFRIAKTLAFVVVLTSILMGGFLAYKTFWPDSKNSSHPSRSLPETPPTHPNGPARKSDGAK